MSESVFDDACNEAPRIAIHKIRTILPKLIWAARSLGQSEASGLLPETSKRREAELNELCNAIDADVTALAKWIGVDK